LYYNLNTFLKLKSKIDLFKMKYLNYISTFLFAGFLKINAQDCNVVNGVLSGFGYKVNQDTDCCTYAVNDQYSVSCDGNAVTGL